MTSEATFVETERQRERLRKSRKLGQRQKLSVTHRALYLEGQTPFDRAQNFDGNFFENFNSLEQNKSKVESQIKDVITEAVNYSGEDEGGDAEVLSSVSDGATLTDKQREALYCELLYTVIHQLGARKTTGELSHGSLFVYAQEALNISEEIHRNLYAKTKEREPPTCFMKVEVIEARNLEAKDANGLSDPYCMLGLMRSDHVVEEKEKNIKAHRKKSKTVRDVLHEDLIHVTKVKENTLNPVWNEIFTIQVTDSYKEKFHLDIWDCDDKDLLVDADTKISQIKGFSGVGRYFKDVMQSARKSSCHPNDNIDDFLGFVEIPVKEIPSSGIDQWFKLEGRSTKSHVDGDCHIRITLTSGKRPDIPDEIKCQYPTAVDIYDAFLREFIKYDCKQSKECGIKRDSGQLCPEAEFILHQHALQNEIHKLQEASMRWSLLSRQHWLRPMKYSSLNLMLLQIHNTWKPGQLSQRKERSLVKSLKYFTDNCWSLLMKYREIFPVTDRGRLNRLVNLLECLVNLYKLEIFKGSVKEPLDVQMSNLLKESALAWYKNLYAWKQPRTKTEEATLCSMVEVADSLVTDIVQAKTSYGEIFAVTKVNYLITVYSQLELMFASDVHNTMRNINQRLKHEGGADIVGEKLFSLYLLVKEIINLRGIADKSDNVYALDDYHGWFKQSVTRWFDIAQVKAKERIRKAVEIDQLLRIDESVTHSTSAIDAVGCFHQSHYGGLISQAFRCARNIREFWRKIAWPIPAGSYVFVMQITNEVCSNASYYADLLFQKIVDNNYYDGDPAQFDVSEQLCVMLNNIEYMRLWLKGLPDSLCWDDVISALETAHGEKGGRHARSSMESMLSGADDDMLNKIGAAITHIGQRMGVDIKRLVFQLSNAPDNIPAEDVVGNLLKYLDDDLMVLNTSVIKSVFERILQSMWEIVLENLYNAIKANLGKTELFYKRQHEALEIVLSFFHADGVGLQLDQLQAGLYGTLVDSLEVRKLSTFKLIQHYFAEKCEEQEKVEEKYGVVTLKVFYDINHKKLLVNVLNAKNLPPLDTNGLADPYVTLRLLPEDLFAKEVKKTQTIKSTLFPLFDELFDFDVEPKLLKETGTCLHITIMDYDKFSNDDIAGHSFFNLSNVMGLREAVAGGFGNVPQQMLNIFHPKPGGQYFELLESRDEETAKLFVKAEKDLYEKTISAHAR